MRRDARERDAGLCPHIAHPRATSKSAASETRASEPALLRIRSLLDLLVVGGSYVLQALREVRYLDLGMTITAFETIVNFPLASSRGTRLHVALIWRTFANMADFFAIDKWITLCDRLRTYVETRETLATWLER